MTETVIMLMTCRKNMHKVEKAKKVWLNKCKTPYVILVGNPKLSLPYSYDKSSHILEVHCADDYESLSKKVYLGIVAVDAEFSPSGILKVDDDILVRNRLLEKFLDMKDKKDYEGDIAKNVDHWSDYHIGKCSYTDSVYVPNIKYCRGPIYYVGRRSIDIICDRMDPSDHLYEDVLMGMVLNHNSVLPRQQPFMTDFLHEYLKNEDIIAFHDIKGEYDLEEVERKYNFNGRQPLETLTLLLLITSVVLILLGIVLMLKQSSHT